MAIWPFPNREKQKGISLAVALVGIMFFAVGLTNSSPIIGPINSQGIGIVLFILGLVYFIESISN